MNILMINPRGMYFDEGVAAYKRISYPMGLMQLSSALKKIEISDDNWSTRETDNPNRNIGLIDAAAEGFGSDDGEGDELVERDGKRIRLFGLNDQDILTKAREFTPDAVFITAQFTKQLDEFYAISKLIKENFPDTLVVGGGIALTQLDQLPLDPSLDISARTEARNKARRQPFENGVDIVVKNEGELAAVKLIDRFEQLKHQLLETQQQFNLRELDFSQFGDLPNLAIKPSGESDLPKVTSEVDISESEFNKLPFPDLSVIQKELYHKKRAHFGEARSDNWIELFTSRGCSKSCTFCATQPFFKSYRKLSDDKVKELLQYYRENGYDEVCVEDDSILDYPDRAVKIFRMIKETGFKQFTSIGGIEFRHLLFDSHGEKFYMNKVRGAHEKWFLTKDEFLEETQGMSKEDIERYYAELVDGSEIIKAMSSDIDPETGLSKENGCYRIYLAMESANQKTLEAVGKVRDYPPGPNGESHKRKEEEAIKMLAENGIETHGGMMMGNPQTEGIKEIMNNIRFCRDMMENGLGRVAFFPYIMLPGSHMSRNTNLPNQLDPFVTGNGELWESYARIRGEHGYLSYGFDTTNMDSLKHGWTAEELTTINVWSNNLFSAGEGRNWTKGETVPKEELEKQIEMISDPEILYQTTALRLMKEGGQQMLGIYHDAIKAVRKELPEYAYELNEDKELSDHERTQRLEESKKIIEDIVKNDPSISIAHDYRAEYATDLTELVMRAPEIKLLPTDETLTNQESSDFINPGEDRELKKELQQETQIPNSELRRL